MLITPRSSKKKLSPRDKARLEGEINLNLSRKAKRKLIREGNSNPYAEVLEQARKLLSENTRLTRTKFAQITEVKRIRVVEKQSIVLTPVRNRFEVFNNTYTPLIESFSTPLGAINLSSTRKPHSPEEEYPPLPSSDSSVGSNIVDIIDSSSSPKLQDSYKDKLVCSNSDNKADSTDSLQILSLPSEDSFDFDLQNRAAEAAKIYNPASEITSDIPAVVEMADFELTYGKDTFKVVKGNINDLLAHATSQYNMYNKIRMDSKSYEKMNVGELTDFSQQAQDFVVKLSMLIADCKQHQLKSDVLDKLYGQGNHMYHTACIVLHQKKAIELRVAQQAAQQNLQQAQADQAQAAQARAPEAQPGHDESEEEGDLHHSSDDDDEPDPQTEKEIEDLKKEIKFLTRKFDSLNKDFVKLQQPSRAQSRAQNPFQGPPAVKKKTPNLTVKPFKGEKKDFLRFKSTFKDRYEETELSQISLAISLGELLEGEARQKVQYLLSNPDEDTYDSLWSSLEIIYGSEKNHKFEKLDNSSTCHM